MGQNIKLIKKSASGPELCPARDMISMLPHFPTTIKKRELVKLASVLRKKMMNLIKFICFCLISMEKCLEKLISANDVF